MLVSVAAAAAENAGLYYEQAIYTDDYALSFFPVYPAVIGGPATLRLRTFSPAMKVTLISDRFKRIDMVYRDGHWWGQFKIPEDYQSGGHFFTVWIKSAAFDPHGIRPVWNKSVVWYKALHKEEPQSALKSGEALPLPPGISAEAKEPLPQLPGELVNLAVVEPVSASGLTIKGSQVMAFRSRSVSGSKEGEAEGTAQSREETLRINISGQAAETEIEASLFRSSASGVSQVAEREENISILLRHGSYEAYLGDFTADLNETEFTRLDKVLQGGWLKGDLGGWGFQTLYSSPKGRSEYQRMYGDNTQGPYSLSSSPAVINSEQVSVDGLRQERGNDYTIDYQAGTVRFLNRVIDRRSIIEVRYDRRETIYQHSTYGLRLFSRPKPDLKLGLTYLNDSDSLTDAQSIRSSMSQEAVDPQGHWVLGGDASYVSEPITVLAEAAYSVRDLDLLSAGTSLETGRAGKLSLSSVLGPLSISGHVKRVGPKFAPIAEADPQQDVLNYGAGFSYRPGPVFGLSADHEQENFQQSGIEYNNLYKRARLRLTPAGLPDLFYDHSESDESNDPVSGSLIRRAITRDSAELRHRFGPLSASLKGSLEEWLRQSPSLEVTDYRRLDLGLATLGNDQARLSSNLELEQRQEPDGTEPDKRTYDLKLTLSPDENFFWSSAWQSIDDSAEGLTSVLDLAFKARLHPALKLEGKYTINSLVDDLPATVEAVAKQSGSLSFDLRPSRQFRLRYLFKPNFTTILRTGTLSYNNEQQRAEFNYLPNKYLMFGLIGRLGRNYSVDPYDYPDYSAKNTSSDMDSTLYTIKIAPWPIVSTELNFFREQTLSQTLASTQEPYSYVPGRAQQGRFDVSLKTSVTERFYVDSSYSFERIQESSGESCANLADNKTYTAALKGSWNYSDNWTFSLLSSFSRTTDYLLSRVTYTLTPGLEIVYRQGERLRLDLGYTHARSYAGAETRVDTFTFKTRYSVSDYVRLNLLAQQENSSAPDYRLTDISGNVEIRL
ncbi:MAG: hypothetical protein JW782_04500 [Candidatus Saganbacteria bacterium]|nr:hypothetical protein [Candidatus Saganbacteria bacterium]